MRNLELAYPEKTAAERKAIVDEVFRSIGRLLYAFSRFPRINRENISEWIRYEGLEHYQAAKKAGHGVLFATAHMGNWELSAFAHALMTEPMNVVIRPLDDPKVDRLVERPPAFRKQADRKKGWSPRDPTSAAAERSRRNFDGSEHIAAGGRFCQLLRHPSLRQYRFREDRPPHRRGSDPRLRSVA